MKLNNQDIRYIIERLQPKISNSLKQTNINHRDDLEQDLKEMIIKKLKSGTLNNNVPDFFEYIQQKISTSQALSEEVKEESMEYNNLFSNV